MTAIAPDGKETTIFRQSNQEAEKPAENNPAEQAAS